MNKYLFIFCFALFVILETGCVFAQELGSNQNSAIIGVKNFSEVKTLPLLNKAISDSGGIKIISYCEGQDLIAVSFDAKKFPTGEQVVYFLEDKGFLVFLQPEMKFEQFQNYCRSQIININSN